MRRYAIAWALIVIALAVFAVDTCAFRARVRDVTSRVAEVRDQADQLDDAVSAVRSQFGGAYLDDAIDPRLDDQVRRLGALTDHLNDLPRQLRALANLLPEHASTPASDCTERSFDTIPGGSTATWSFRCSVTPNKQVVLVVSGTVMAAVHSSPDAAADVTVTCVDCEGVPARPNPEAAWHGLRTFEIPFPAVSRSKWLEGTVTVGCPGDLQTCAAQLTMTVQ